MGALCILLTFSAHFGLSTYVRPFLERAPGVSANAVAGALLSFGAANFVGTLVAGRMIERSPRLASGAMPFLIAPAAFASVGLATRGLLTIGLVAVWGFAYGVVPVAWSTWMANAAPDETEAGGGLLVATVHIAIALGAAGGGFIDGLAGVSGVFLAGGLLMLAAAGASMAAASPRKGWAGR